MTELASAPATTPRVGSAKAIEVVTAFFDAYRRRDVETMTGLCTDNADFSYIPFEVWAKQRVMRGDGKVRTIGKVIWSGRSPGRATVPRSSRSWERALEARRPGLPE